MQLASNVSEKLWSALGGPNQTLEKKIVCIGENRTIRTDVLHELLNCVYGKRTLACYFPELKLN